MGAITNSQTQFLGESAATLICMYFFPLYYLIESKKICKLTKNFSHMSCLDEPIVLKGIINFRENFLVSFFQCVIMENLFSLAVIEKQIT